MQSANRAERHQTIAAILKTQYTFATHYIAGYVPHEDGIPGHLSGECMALQQGGVVHQDPMEDILMLDNSGYESDS